MEKGVTGRTEGERPRGDGGAGMAEQRLWSESEIDTKKQKVLAFCAESREGEWEMEGKYRDELAEYESIWGRPHLWAFAGGAVFDLKSGVVERYGPDEGAAMMLRLDGADILTSYGGYGNVLDYFSEYGKVENLKAKHIRITLEYEVDHPEMDEEPYQPLPKPEYSAQRMYWEGRIEDLLKHCEAEARRSAEVYRAVETIERLQEKPYVVPFGRREEVTIEPLVTAIYVHRSYARYDDRYGDEDE